MSDLFEKRVEAAARSLYENMKRTTPGGKNYPSWDSESRFADVWRGDARAALLAADAVVTEEMIAETILKALVFTNENSEAWADGLARDIAALFRGGAK